jgi:hypothetical protein
MSCYVRKKVRQICGGEGYIMLCHVMSCEEKVEAESAEARVMSCYVMLCYVRKKLRQICGGEGYVLFCSVTVM